MTVHFLRDDDLTPEDQSAVLDLAVRMKDERFVFKPLAGPKSVAVFFDKQSLRTRISFEAGIAELGGNPIIVDTQNTHFGRGESLLDAGRVVSRYVSAIVMRTFGDDRLAELAAGSRVPVINALTDGYHPCQLLADLLTIREQKGALAGLTVTFLGDGADNMVHSYLLAGATAGMHVRVACPADYMPDERVVADADAIAVTTGGSVTIYTDPAEATAGADVVVTDTWVSMGKEDEKAARVASLGAYKVDADLMALAKPDAIFLHCLPADRGYEVTSEVIDGPQSVIWDEAENRLHAQKALLVWLLERA